MRAARFPTRSELPSRLAGFFEHLRANGYPAGLGQLETGLRALDSVNAVDRREVFLALAAVCADNAERRKRFGEVFDAYWLDHRRQRTRSSTGPAQTHRAARPGLIEQHLMASGAGNQDTPDDGEDEADREGEGRLAGVRRESISRVDLRALVSDRELEQARAIARRLAEAIRDRRSRRRKAARRGAMLDLRRIARRSIGHGGEPFELLRRRRPDRPVQVTALLDVSGSMKAYCSVFLAFLKGLASADSRMEAFLMHTRLVQVTAAMKGGEGVAALGRLSLMANGFGGGTRLGSCLRHFVDQHAARIGKRSAVIILSDGYDTDPPEFVADALRRLRRRGCRIVWLNPLKGWAGYEPVARSMAAALPYIDVFAAANTLEALAALEPELARL